MSYFTDVYLKRMNMDGTTRQERIKTREEKEFDNLALKRSKYQATIICVNGESCNILSDLQKNKWNESKIISNLQISNNERTFATGDLLTIYRKVNGKEEEKEWLVFFVEDDITKGFQTFKVICLDSAINITDEYGNTKYSIPVKFVNSTSNQVSDLFSYSKSNYGYREPEGARIFICQDSDVIKKDEHYEYKDRRWQIYGKDNISIDNVAYVTSSEKLQKENEPLSSEDIMVGENDNFFLNGR